MDVRSVATSFWTMVLVSRSVTIEAGVRINCLFHKFILIVKEKRKKKKQKCTVNINFEQSEALSFSRKMAGTLN